MNWNSQGYTKQAYRDKLKADLQLQVAQANIEAKLIEAKRQCVKDVSRCFFRCAATVGVTYIASELMKWWANR